MSTPENRHSTQPAPSMNSGIDLLAYVVALLNAKYWVIGAALVCGILGLGYGFTLTDEYETVVRTDLVDIDDPGGVSPDNRRASEVLTLVEHGFVLSSTKDNYLDVMLAKMRSRLFTIQFIENNNVLPALWAEHWDPETESWIDGFEPDRGASFVRFNEQVRFIDHNTENDIISVRMRWTDPALARDWANQYVADFNNFMRNQALEEVARKRAFLEAELAKNSVVDIRQSIFRLIEAQTAVAMLANSREEYVLQIIDPAILPFASQTPGAKLYLILGVFAGGFIAVACVFARVLLLDILAMIKAYQLHPPARPATTQQSDDHGEQ